MPKNTPEICIKPKALGVSEIYRNQLQQFKSPIAQRSNKLTFSPSRAISEIDDGLSKKSQLMLKNQDKQLKQAEWFDKQK